MLKCVEIWHKKAITCSQPRNRDNQFMEMGQVIKAIRQRNVDMLGVSVLTSWGEDLCEKVDERVRVFLGQ